MATNKLTGILGMARRANRVSLGHDASLDALKKSSGKLILLSCDASDRLKDEFKNACEEYRVKCITLEYTMNELGAGMGAKTTAVLSVNDEGFAKRINELILEDD